MKRQGSIASLQSPAFCLSLSPGISTSIAHPLNGYFVEFFLSFFFPGGINKHGNAAILHGQH